MRHPADIGFVDAHAKGDGGDNNQPVLLLEPHFGVAPGLGLQPCMITCAGMTRFAQGLT